MAGTAKPHIAGLGEEASYIVIGGNGEYMFNGMGLFDGTTVNEWNTNRIAYWNKSTSYLEIEILSDLVNIWRSGTSSWKHHAGTLLIKKWNSSTSTYDDVTHLYPQTVTQIGDGEWEKTISNLDKGIYRFEYTSNRLDSEWFIEQIVLRKLALKNNTSIYSLDNQTLITLPSSSNKNMISYGLRVGKEVQLDVPFDKIKYVQDTSEVLGSGKVFTHEIDTSKVKVNKIIL